MDSTELRKLSDRFLDVVLETALVSKEISTFGTDTVLYGAEIGMIDLVRANPGISVTDLADRLVVTKGAVSQLLKRLEKKGMIIKNVDLGNRSRLNVSLSEKGEVASCYHERRRNDFKVGFALALAKGTDENIAFLGTFLGDLAGIVELYRRNGMSVNASGTS